MFTITIQKPTGDEAVAELMRVAKFWEQFQTANAAAAVATDAPDTVEATGITVDAEPAEAEPRKPRAKRAAKVPVDLPPSEPEAEQAAPAPAPAPAPAALDPEAMRVQIRQLLTPLMKGESADAARALVKRYGSSLGEVSADNLPLMLAEAEAL